MADSRLPGSRSGNGDESRLRELEKNNAILMAWLVQNQRDSKALVKNYEELLENLPEVFKEIVKSEFSQLMTQFQQLLRKGESMSGTDTKLPPISQTQWEEMLNALAIMVQGLGALAVPTLPHEPEAVGGAWNSLLEGPASEDPVAIQALHVVFETMQRLIAFLAVERGKDQEIEQLRAQVQSKEETCGKAAGFIRGLQARIQQLEKK